MSPASVARRKFAFASTINFAATPPDNAITDPTERSKSPEIKRSIIPIATIVFVATPSRILEILSKVAKLMGQIIADAIQITTTVIPSDIVRSFNNLTAIPFLLMSNPPQNYLFTILRHTS